jgi:hypothetical protein
MRGETIVTYRRLRIVAVKEPAASALISVLPIAHGVLALLDDVENSAVAISLIIR